MTNADKIRAMSDEELLDFLWGANIFDCMNGGIPDEEQCPALPYRSKHNDCKECFGEWLKADEKPLEDPQS